VLLLLPLPAATWNFRPPFIARTSAPTRTTMSGASSTRRQPREPQPPPFSQENAKLLFVAFASEDDPLSMAAHGFSQMIDARQWLGKTAAAQIFRALCSLSNSSGNARAAAVTMKLSEGDAAAESTALPGSSRGGGLQRLSFAAFLLFLQDGVDCLDLDRLQISKRDQVFRCVSACDFSVFCRH
jgi:hypothetical protein